ncbi:MAG: DUF3305 domain-containing protein [Marinobacter sp.]|uniref:DUF3305 domain-containing protein n=1 Tax=Marinobacter sp. TaxID=50741 RepID=UPI003C685B18
MTRRTESWKRELLVGAVVRRTPGVTRWARDIWKPVAVIPGAPEAFWKEMVREGDVVDYHAGTVAMELFRADVESYLVSLNMATPSVWIIMDRDESRRSPAGWFVSAITASAYEAQDALDSGESIVEAVPIRSGARPPMSSSRMVACRGTDFVKARCSPTVAWRCSASSCCSPCSTLCADASKSMAAPQGPPLNASRPSNASATGCWPARSLPSASPG